MLPEPSPASDVPPTSRVSRRDVMRWTAAGGVLAGLAACTGGDGAPQPRPVPEVSGRSAPTPSPGSLLTFPSDFLWGSATSAYQVEGAAALDGRGPSVWDTFTERPGTVQDGSSGAVAADQYHRYRTDVALMADLGLRSYRFSVSWSRVMPTGRGEVNRRGLDHYRRLVDTLREAGIAPIATLWHWDTPEALQAEGGWESRDTAAWFAEYAGVVVEALGDRVHTVLTLNEPKTVVNLGYVSGVHAPGLRDSAASVRALHHLHLGHGLAVAAARAARPRVRVGPCLNLAPAYATDDSEAARRAAVLADTRENALYLEPVLAGRYPAEADLVLGRGALDDVVRPDDLKTIAAPVDLLAVNYYNPVFVDAAGQQVRRHPVATPAEWLEIYPDGLYDILMRVHRDFDGPELMVTESGRPDITPAPADPLVDDERIEFLKAHFVAAHRALSAGVRLTGYQVWSLLDNFEWAAGYTQRWGLVRVDFETQRRTPKKSAGWYRDVIASGGVRV